MGDEIQKEIPDMTQTTIKKETEDDGMEDATHRRRASTFDLTDVTPIPTFEPQDAGFPDLYGIDDVNDNEPEIINENEEELNTPSRYIIRVESIDDDDIDAGVNVDVDFEM